MPGQAENLFYSVDVGPVHCVIFSTKFYYFDIEFGPQQIKNQYEWLEKDLAEANLALNRAKQIITFGHRPFICSNANEECTTLDARHRIGQYGLEELFYKYGVGIEFWGYQRFWPVYNNIVKNGSYEFPYINPKAPIQIVNGAGGSQEGTDGFGPPKASSAFRSTKSGYGIMRISPTQFDYKQISTDTHTSVVIDEFSVIKQYHGPYN